MGKRFIIGGLFILLLLLLYATCDSKHGRIMENQENQVLQKEPQMDNILPIENINVYLENSGSMNGYVKGNTGFEQSIYAFLTEIQISNLVKTLNLNYVNSKVVPLGYDLKKFIHNIEPDDFKQHGGNLGTSDIAIVLDSVLNCHNKNDISIFISDCIVSLGGKYSSPQDMNSYLIEQRTNIRKLFTQTLERADQELTVVICQLNSLFDGKFFNKFDHPKYYKGERPFYIWLIGKTSHIKQLLDKVALETLKGNGAELENVYTLIASSKEIDYRILLMPRLGRFDLDRENPKTTICNIRKENKGEQKGVFMFSVGANLDQLPLSDNYLLDNTNYEISNKDYSLQIKKQNGGLFSYIFNISSQTISRGNIIITLKNQFPIWVENKTDFLGNDLVKDDATNKTYGLKYLIEGIYDAFTTYQNSFAEFNITIN